VALVFRHLQPLGEEDRARLVAFAQEHGFALYLQPGGIESVAPLWPEAPTLAFTLPQWDVTWASGRWISSRSTPTSTRR
jgi:23S rRNA (uracil1939-C5)-methyltransferase